MHQKLPLDEGSSFVARTYETPYWETPYHQHNEYELMVIKESRGTVFVGDFVGSYQAGEVFLHGVGLPHWYRKDSGEKKGSSMVVQFRDDVFGAGFFDLPEMNAIRKLLSSSSRGIRCTGELRESLGPQLLDLEEKQGFDRVLSLLSMLQEIGLSTSYEYLSTIPSFDYTDQDRTAINLVFNYTMKNFQRKISLKEVANLSNKSISSFSHYFKKTTKIGYVRFLTQIRISHACKLLKETDFSITEICYMSGFNNWANFSKHFKTIVDLSPSQYRQKLRGVTI